MRKLSNITKGDNTKSKKGRIVILVHDTCSRLVLHFYQVHKSIPKDIHVTEWTQNLFQTKLRVITPKVRKPELLYISTEYYQNIPKSIRLTERTQNQCIIIIKYNKGR